MANVKITGLTAITAPANTDVLPIVDVSADVTKKVSIADLLESAGDGTAALPAFAFDSDKDIGMYRVGANQLGFATAGTSRIVVDASGNVGIGTASPLNSLHVENASGVGVLLIEGSNLAQIILSDNNGGTNNKNAVIRNSQQNLLFGTQSDSFSAFSESLRIDSSGRLLVGLSSSADDISLAISGNSSGGSGDSKLLLVYEGTAPGSNDTLSSLSFADNSHLTTAGKYAAEIKSQRDGGTWTSGSSMPGRLMFSTTANGASSPTERLRIKSDGTLHAIKSGSLFANAEQTVAVFQRSSAAGSTSKIAIISGNSASSHVHFGDTDDEDVGQIAYDHSNNSMQFVVNAAERMRIDSSGNVGIGTSSPDFGIHLHSSSSYLKISNSGTGEGGSDGLLVGIDGTGNADFWNYENKFTRFATNNLERMRIDSLGAAYFGKATSNINTEGFYISQATGTTHFTTGGGDVCSFNRLTNDGRIIRFLQASIMEGSISVSGSTVSYNGAHLSRWSQLPSGAARIEILRGSVLSNLDEMCEWGEEDNEQLNRMKVSDVEGDKNVSGVFQAWDDDDDTYVNDFYCAMTGDFVIRIAQGTTVERGDLLMSAGDGTAKPQDDDIVRSKTIAKVTSTTVSETYADNSYCVPCVLMAC